MVILNMDEKTSPSVTVIVLNWNGKVDTLECLGSLAKLDYPNFKIVVVDNASSDNSVVEIRAKFPEVVILETGDNLGFAGGNNVGIRWALQDGTDYILILNNDTIVAHDLLNAFVSAAKQQKDKAVLGAKIYFFDTPDMIWFAGGVWVKEQNKFIHLGWKQHDCSDFANISETDYITGCAMFIHADIFNDIGLLDEKFFLVYEETDWCYRAKARGYKCLVIPEAKLWHKVSASFGGSTSPIVRYFSVRNKLFWGKKHCSFSTMLKLHLESMRLLYDMFFPPLSCGKEAVCFPKNIYWSWLRWKETRKREKFLDKAALAGLRDFYLGRYGNCPDKVRKLGK